MQKEESVTVRWDPHAAAAALTEARRKLEAMHEAILSGRMAGVAETEVPPLVVNEAGLAVTGAIAMPTPASMPGGAATDIARYFRSRGCPVCRHMTDQASDFFAQWQYRIGVEEQAQAEFAGELGFCPLHTWQLLAVSSPHGASVGYARLVERVARSLKLDIGASTTGDAVRRLLRDSRNCRVCGLLRQTERVYIGRLAAVVGGAAGRSQYRRSQGACLRHLGMLLDATRSDCHEFLLSHAVQRFEEDAEDMRSYAMKHEALRRELQNRDDEDAYRRAVIRMVGGRSVCMTSAEDGEIR